MRFVLAPCTATLLAICLAQTKPAPQQPTFRTGVNFVRVDVYPTIDGRPVTDLKQEDFEVFEDRVPQRVETFEHVVIRAPGGEVDRDEPANVDESNEAAGNPRSRLFVLFYDTMHTLGYATPAELAGGPLQPFMYDPRTVGRAFSAFFHTLIGQDDLVALMTPEMSVTALTFTRRPSTLDAFLLTGGLWKMRAQRRLVDEAEQLFMNCGPRLGASLIDLRRRNLTLGALQGLVTHLQNLREGRKVVFLVTEGFGVSASRTGAMDGLGRIRLQRPPGIGIPAPPPFGARGEPSFIEACKLEVQAMARVDTRQQFLDLLREAGRTNVIFYPVDPRGLTAERLNQDALYDLANATHGKAIVNLNDPTSELKRVADEVSSYYLLGYYSTNSKTDGRFRAISVRVRRRRVQVRARPGYYSMSEADIAARNRADAPPDPEAERLGKALAALGVERADIPLRLAAACSFERPAAESIPKPLLLLAGELDVAAARRMVWQTGGEATATLRSAADGRTIAVERAAIAPAARSFTIAFRGTALAPGDYRINVRLAPRSSDAEEEMAQVRVQLPDVAATGALLGEPMLFRSGPYTGREFQRTADRRYRREERIRVDVPLVAPVDAVAVQMLDRKGRPLAVPMTAGCRDDGATRFASTETALGSFAPADYLVEISVRRGEKTEKVVTAFRILP